MPKVMLHCCCAVCASYPFFQLKELGYDVVLYFYNPNIYPLEEYKRRLDELKKFSEINNAHLIVDDGDYDEWKILISGLENEPEKGKRCAKCFQIRLKKTVEKGIEQKCDCFATTLSVSPHKNSKQIFEVAHNLETEKLPFLGIDFKKQNGFLKTSKLADEYGFYRQKYCGCEFSVR